MRASNQSCRSGSGQTFPEAPAAIVVLSSAGLVLTAYLLGAHWLGRLVLGLPVGLWMIASVFVAWRRGWLGLLETTLPLAAKTPRLDLSPTSLKRFGFMVRSGVAFKSSIFRVCRSIWDVRSLTVGSLKQGVADDLDSRPDLADPVHIAVLARRDQAEALRDPQPAIPVRWTLLESLGSRDHLDCDLVFCADDEQGGTAEIPEQDDRPATWFDWASPRPLSFASVFPHQIDPARISVGVLPTLEDPDPLVGALLVAAAASGRIPQRLSITDRLRGRIPLDGPDRPGTIDPGAFRVRAMRRMSDLLGKRDPASATTLEQTAARVLSAWLVTPGSRVDMSERRAMLEQACLFAPNQPEVWLRLGAVRIADLDDAGGIEALLRGDPAVRAARDQLVIDQAQFVQSELEHGDSGSMTLGRVAAGFCLLAAQHDYERLEFLKEDLLEDLDHAGWLIGRDQDTALLRGIFAELHRVRRAEARGLPIVSDGNPEVRTAA